MPIRPQYKRVSATPRRFFNREGLIEAYDAELGNLPAGPRILNVVGVGGIGKSRLLQELRNRTGDRARTAWLDLQVPSLRQRENALAVLRVEFGGQGVEFDRFDIAYATLWQRLHPHLRLDRNQAAFAEESEILSQILDGAVGLPVFGTAAGLVRLTGRAFSSRRRRLRIENDPTLGELDSLTNTELGHAVSYLFAEDVRSASARQPFVVFVDAYEALAPDPLLGGRSYGADGWLRDLLGQLDDGLCVVASREPLRWSDYDADWSAVIREVDMGGLPMTARIDLLAQGGMGDIPTQRSVAEASAGVPFYLHLALDTHLHAPARTGGVATSEQIVQRFLQHVSPDEVRVLELLSVARTFDYDALRAIGTSFNLPVSRLLWEPLTSYSFVYALTNDRYRLHQLMATALQDHLSTDVKISVHARLRQHYEAVARRLDTADSPPSGKEQAAALREAVYHGVHAGDITPEGIQECADQVLVLGERQFVDGIAQDLRDYTAGRGVHPEMQEVADCLEAESRLALGDARGVTAMLQGCDRSVRKLVPARLALAAANAQRIAGESRQAARTFQRVWDQHRGRARTLAGLCVADIRMWTGDFRGAFALAEEVLSTCPADDHALRGDLTRLMHLGHRFLLDFESAASALEEAETEYRRADAVFGLANIATNKAELACFRDPEAAVHHAAVALEVQKDLGAQHEVGKAYTAMAMAQTLLGEHERAASSYSSARAALSQAGYRSGQARADMFEAFLLFRLGEQDSAEGRLLQAARELEACEVYPSLIVALSRAAHRMGRANRELDEAAERAHPAVRPLGTFDALMRRTDDLLAMFLGSTS